MKKIIGWFVLNPVASNLLMVVLIFAGILSLSTLREEEFPAFDIGLIAITVPYLGAAPEDAERGVCMRIEETLEGTDGIFKLTSRAREGACTVLVEITAGFDDQQVTNEVKTLIDSISTFPAETERPVISYITITNFILDIAIFGDTSEKILKELGLSMRDDLVALNGISQAEVLYTKPDMISIEIPEQTLREYNITLDHVANAVSRSSFDLPSGALRTAQGEILLRTQNQAYYALELEDIPVLTSEDGSIITVSDLGTVIDGFEEGDTIARYNGQPAVIVRVEQTGTEDLVLIKEQINNYLANGLSYLPQGINVEIATDVSDGLSARIENLKNSAFSGLILVLLLLGIPFNFRLAMWVAAGIPVAIIGAFSLFPVLDLSINTLSVVAFILVLGIIVDDAIVVGERIYAHEQEGKSRIQAAIDGAFEVSKPVIFGVLTTVAAFIPLILTPGRVGEFFSIIGQVVVICLLFSLIEVLFILPGHLAHRRKNYQSVPTEKAQSTNKIILLKQYLSIRMDKAAFVSYADFLKRILPQRRAILAGAFAILIIAFSFITSGRINVQFFPNIEGDTVVARLTMPEGIHVSRTAEAAEAIELAAEELKKELLERYPDQPNLIEGSFSSIGQTLGGGFSAPQSHLAEIWLYLPSVNQRQGISTRDIENLWRELTPPILDSVELTFSSDSLQAGDPISLDLRGRDIDMLAEVAARVRSELSSFPAVNDISDSFRSGKQEIKLNLNRNAYNLGLTPMDMASQVRSSFYGLQAQRVQRGTEDVRIMVRYPENERASIGDLENMMIRTPTNIEVPFSTVADYTIGRGFSTIVRIDRQRSITVRADVDRSMAAPESIIAQLKDQIIPALEIDYPDIEFAFSGEAEQRAESFGGLFALFPLALFIIYALLAVPLNSYLQPLIIMSIIPFSLIGSIAGHLIMGQPIIITSIFGMIALCGVVVNSSLIYVDWINKKLDQGLSIDDAVIDAGKVRFRPIILTSFTTFMGLMPLMLLVDPSTAFIVPMAISLGYGVLFSTLITLILIPCLAKMIHRFK
jgi:multidrug efflux pump subunit AcrB